MVNNQVNQPEDSQIDAHIEDEEELASFMEFCKFTDQYLGELVEYDLIVAINDNNCQ